MPLTKHDKELIAVAISVAAGCRPCTTFHLGEARRSGASEAAIEKMVAGAVCVRKSAAEGMRRHALGLEPEPSGCGCAVTDALAEMAALGASLAVNCTVNIAKHLSAARGLGVSQDLLDEVLALTRKIRLKAIAHGETDYTGGTSPAKSCAEAAARAGGCC